MSWIKISSYEWGGAYVVSIAQPLLLHQGTALVHICPTVSALEAKDLHLRFTLAIEAIPQACPSLLQVSIPALPLKHGSTPAPGKLTTTLPLCHGEQALPLASAAMAGS